VRVYGEKDADLGWLKGRICAVIGFGSQGSAQALNLRDSRMAVVVGLYPKSKSRTQAKRSRFKVFDTAEAVQRADIIFLAVPDTKIP
jgi:ketol-acid reductoisomerase